MICVEMSTNDGIGVKGKEKDVLEFSGDNLEACVRGAATNWLP